MEAFVVMPFDPSFDAVFELLIKPPLEQAGFEVTRADLSNNQTQILRDIVTMLARADLVLADVTDLNGNVMYELGLAHAMGKRTVMLTQSIAQLPFDLHSYRANEYSTHFSEASKLKEKLEDIAKGVVEGSLSFGNPVQDFAPEYTTKQVATTVTEATSGAAIAVDDGDGDGDGGGDGSDSDAEEEDDRGFLDHVLALSEASEEVQEHTSAIQAATEAIGEKVVARGEQITKIARNLGDKAAPVLRQVMRDTAGECNEFSELVEKSNVSLETAIRKLGESTNGVAQGRPIDSEDAEQQIRQEIEGLDEAIVLLSDASKATTSFAQSMLELPQMEQNLNRASKRAAQAVTNTASLIDLTQSEFVRARGLFEERLQGIRG